MGKAFEIHSLEEMCDLMCGNVVPEESKKEKEYMGTECFHCGHKAIIWDNDFDFEDFGYEGAGVVHCCHCTHCGAEVEYKVSFDDEEKQ